MEFAKRLQEFAEFFPERSFEQIEMTPRKREIIYAAAFGKYEVGDYGGAADLFTILAMHDPFDERFWRGLASCLQMQKQYDEALRAWAILALINGDNGDAHFHAAECLLSRGEKEEAKLAIKAAKRVMDETDRYRSRADLIEQECHNG